MGMSPARQIKQQSSTGGLHPMAASGFKSYQADGFTVMLPTGWDGISSSIKYKIVGDPSSINSTKAPVSETYEIDYEALDGIHYDTSIEIVPKSDFAKDVKWQISFYGFKPLALKYADHAYVYKAYSDDMTQPSQYTIIALRGDVCYTISARFEGFDPGIDLQGSWYDIRKKELKKYLSDTKTLVGSFKLSGKAMSFSAITKASQKFMSLKK
jgi:hypothetical protein